MMAALVMKEVRAQLRDGRLWVLGIALMLLFAVMLALAQQARDAAERERRDVETVSRAQWDHQGDKNPHRGAHFGLYAFKPSSPLAAVEPGIDAQAGQALWLEPHKRNMAMFTPAADAAPSIGLGALTPAFVLSALVPLLIVVLGHGAVTRERESGTLRMLQACGLRARPLLFGKWLGLCAAVSLVLLPALLLGVWLVTDGSGAVEAIALCVALLVSCAVWAAVTVSVSAFCRSDRAALLTLIGVWVAAVFLVPRLGATAAERLTPLPTGQDFWSDIGRDIERGLPGDGDAKQRLRAFEAKLLAEHGVSRLEDLPLGANAARRLFRDGYAARVHALHFDALWATQLHQQALLRGLTAISPYAPTRAVGGALAGTDLAHRRHFEDAAEQYRQTFTTRMDEWDRDATRGLTSFESRYAGDAQWQAIPPWTYEPPGWRFSLDAALPDLGLLGLWFAAAIGGLWFSARRVVP
jgi:ABC-2 type transport system permease protein